MAKDLPEPFSDSLVNNLTDISSLGNVKNPESIKKLGFGIIPFMSDPNFQALAYHARTMKQLSPIYYFLGSVDRKGLVLDHNTFVTQLSEIMDEPDLIVELLEDKSALQIIHILADNTLSAEGKAGAIIQLDNLNLAKFVKQLEKNYRRTHKTITKYLRTVRKNFNDL